MKYRGLGNTGYEISAVAYGGVMELMQEMKEKGIARKIGFTAHSEKAALKALSLYDFDTVLFPSHDMTFWNNSVDGFRSLC